MDHTPFQSSVITFWAGWKKGEHREPQGFSSFLGLHLGRHSPFLQYFPTVFKHQQLQPQLPSQTLLRFLVWDFLNIIIKKKKNTGKVCGLAESKCKLVGAASRTWHFSSIVPSGEQPHPKTLHVEWIPQSLKSLHQTLSFIHLSMISLSWETQ